MRYGENVFRGNNSICNAFASYFQSVYKQDRASYVVNESECCNINLLNINFITKEEIRQSIRKLKPKKAAGIDCIPPYIIKGCSEIFINPLHILYNLTLKYNKFPTLWKTTKVTPVHKNGPKEEISNYRPVSVLSGFAKIYEQILHDRIYNHVEPSISVKQHGFLKKKSTFTNLAIFTHYIYLTLDNHNQVDVIYTDFAKAFDQVNHDILLKKLATFGLSTNLLLLFSSYLSDRTQLVKFNNQKSFQYFCYSGVPQGSNLGPLLFLILINDISEAISYSEILLFADDLKIYKEIKSDEDCFKIQIDLESLVQWSQRNDLPFNFNKCKCLRFSRKRDPHSFSYHMDGNVLLSTNETKDLGIWFDSKLTFTTHILHITKDAYKNLGFILRTSQDFRNVSTFKILYTALVRSKLEYGSVIWSPHCKKQNKLIERIQNKFIRCLDYKQTTIYPTFDHYNDLLKLYSMESLYERRKKAALGYLYKIFNNSVDASDFIHNFTINVPTLMTRPKYNFFRIPRRRTEAFANSPLIRMMTLYNEISSNVDLFSVSLKEFLRNI